MKLSTNYVALAVFLSASASALAEPIHHRRAHHHHQRRGVTRTETVTHTVTVDEAGIPWTPSTEEFKVASVATPSPVRKQKEDKKETEAPEPTTTSEPILKPTKEPVIKKPLGPAGIGAPFPDGEIDCDHFPEEYGAIPVEWVGYNKWTGIQETHTGGGAKPDCEEGALCSYACPPGYSKSQWPEIQPASGESHGGLLCKDGKLYRTNSNSEVLCEKGAGNVYVRNKLNKAVPICRTDYPGSENMVVPLYSTPGSTLELTCPKTESAYKWRGGKTSAQYYVNPQGTSLEDGCVWGDPNGDLGNWSPINFGASTDNGIAYLGMFQNQLNPRPLNFNVRIVGGPGSKVLGNCKYEDGKFQGDGATADGCTSSLVSGEAFYELY